MGETCELEEKGSQETCMMNQIQQTNSNYDSFLVEMDGFSQSIDKDQSSPNSRITLQRSLTRKGSQKESEKTSNSRIDNKFQNPTSSPRGEKAAVPGHTEPQIHHQITIAAAAATTTTSDSKVVVRRSSFKRSSQSRIFDSRKILFYLATLSSMGSILLIYFTLSMRTFNGNENGQAWEAS